MKRSKDFKRFLTRVSCCIALVQACSSKEETIFVQQPPAGSNGTLAVNDGATTNEDAADVAFESSSDAISPPSSNGLPDIYLVPYPPP